MRPARCCCLRAAAVRPRRARRSAGARRKSMRCSTRWWRVTACPAWRWASSRTARSSTRAPPASSSPAKRQEDRRRHAVQDRLQQQVDDHGDAGAAGRCRQAALGRSGAALAAGLPHVRPLGHARDAGARPADPQQRPARRRRRPDAVAGAEHASPAPTSSTAWRYLKPQHSFRAGYDYDNLLYIVAGEVAAAAGGAPYEAAGAARSVRAAGHGALPGRRSGAATWSAMSPSRTCARASATSPVRSDGDVIAGHDHGPGRRHPLQPRRHAGLDRMPGCSRTGRDSQPGCRASSARRCGRRRCRCRCPSACATGTTAISPPTATAGAWPMSTARSRSRTPAR